MERQVKVAQALEIRWYVVEILALGRETWKVKNKPI